MLLRYILFSFLIFSAGLAIDTEVSTTPKPDIIDNNHYYSESTLQKTYKISELHVGTPVAVIIKPPSSVSSSNPITITITSGSNKK